MITKNTKFGALRGLALAGVLGAWCVDSSQAAFLISQSGEQFTFSFAPTQSTPLTPGFASYASGTSSGIFHFLAWGLPTTIYFEGVPVISNSLFDAAGLPVADSLVSGALFNFTTNEVLGFGNTSSSFSIAGGQITLELSLAFTGRVHVLPSAPVSSLALGTTFDPGTTGSSSDLVVSMSTIPEPSSVLLASLGLGVVAFRRKRQTT